MEKQKEMKEKLAKEAIYEAALQVISKTGNETFRMQDIADAAGIATGTLYNYFENKESLIYHVDSNICKAIIEEVQSCSQKTSPVPQKLTGLFESMFKFCEKYHVVFDLAKKFIVVDQVRKEEKRERMELLASCIKKVIDEGIEQKLFKKVDPDAAAKFFLFAMIGIMHTQCESGNFDFSENRKLFIESCRGYLAVEN